MVPLTPMAMLPSAAFETLIEMVTMSPTTAWLKGAVTPFFETKEMSLEWTTRSGCARAAGALSSNESRPTNSANFRIIPTG